MPALLCITGICCQRYTAREAHFGGCRCQRRSAALTGSTARTAMSAPGTSRTFRTAAWAVARRAVGLHNDKYFRREYSLLYALSCMACTNSGRCCCNACAKSAVPLPLSTTHAALKADLTTRSWKSGHMRLSRSWKLVTDRKVSPDRISCSAHNGTGRQDAAPVHRNQRKLAAHRLLLPLRIAPSTIAAWLMEASR